MPACQTTPGSGVSPLMTGFVYVPLLEITEQLAVRMTAERGRRREGRRIRENGAIRLYSPNACMRETVQIHVPMSELCVSRIGASLLPKAHKMRSQAYALLVLSRVI